MGHFVDGYPFAGRYLICVLNIDLLVAVDGLQKAHEVEVLLVELVAQKFAETQNWHKFAPHARFFPNFSNRGFFQRFTCFNQTPRQFP